MTDWTYALVCLAASVPMAIALGIAMGAPTSAIGIASAVCIASAVAVFLSRPGD